MNNESMNNDKAPSVALPTNGTTESRIGPLALEGGYPTDATVTRLEKPNVVLRLADYVG